MADEPGTPIEQLRTLASRAGMELTDQELLALKPLYDKATEVTASLHDLDLGAEEPAVTFDPRSPHSA